MGMRNIQRLAKRNIEQSAKRTIQRLAKRNIEQSAKRNIQWLAKRNIEQSAKRERTFIRVDHLEVHHMTNHVVFVHNAVACAAERMKRSRG